jgi:O-antigen ligase
MRVYLVYLGTLFLVTYAWKDWFPAAAGLVLMIAFHDHPDMPRELLGVPGLNLWNVLLLAAVPAWLMGRRREGLHWDLPRPAGLLLLVYVAIISVSFLRLLLDPGPVELQTADLVGEYLVNPLKYLVPAVMIFDGARSRPRLQLALAGVLGACLFLSILVVKWVPLSDAMSGGELGSRALRRLDRETGFFRTGLSVMLAGASWAVLAVRSLSRSRLLSLALLGVAALMAFAMALTGGRGGYLAWALVGLVLSLLRWRAALVIAPLAVSLILAFAPGVRERALEGIRGQEGGRGEGGVDTELLSAGRLVVWPFMLAKVGESPLVGFGRLGYQRSGLHAQITAEVDSTFPHPHNAYLEWLLDNGWLGMAPMVVLYALVLACSLILFADSRHPFFVAAGGTAFALVFAQLVGSLTGRHWYPDEETVTLWAAVGLMLRVWVERSRGVATGDPT